MTNEYIGKHAKLEHVSRPWRGYCSQGEVLYVCPCCHERFEYVDTIFELEFAHVRKDIYQHKCGQLIDMS